jgi:hypothetical protein
MMDRQLTRISPQDVGRFSIDGKNRLYWDGELIHTEAVVRLSKFQSIVVICAGFATMASSVAAWTTYLTRKPVSINPVSASSPCPVSIPQTQH